MKDLKGACMFGQSGGPRPLDASFTVGQHKGLHIEKVGLRQGQ